MTDYWFRCPACNEARMIDGDQVAARKQIACGCGFKQTGLVEPVLPHTAPLPHSMQFTVSRSRVPKEKR